MATLADKWGCGPTRLYEPVAGGYRVTVRPPFAGFLGAHVILSADQYRRYREWVAVHDNSPHIQDAFPELTPADREVLKSGMTYFIWALYHDNVDIAHYGSTLDVDESDISQEELSQLKDTPE